ncbi:hypothetical protein ULG90_24735 [Halopseudomonas pachastrellae]|nr:hypothetical protein ULG90_24735 [Halopseudomonas pachastrellae]
MTLKAPHGPVETEIKVHIISDDGEARGVATIGLGFGQYATPAVIAARIDEFEKNDLLALLRATGCRRRKSCSTPHALKRLAKHMPRPKRG